MKKLLIATALGLPLLASAQNLLVNGSFEDGLAGWVVVNGNGTTHPVATVTYGTQPGAFGEIVPADDAAANRGPDAVGTQALYFVDDDAFQSVTQTFVVETAGDYNLGLSYYVPANGAANPNDVFVSVNYGSASQSAFIGSLAVASWQGNNVVQNLQPGSYAITLSFAPPAGGHAMDILVDRVYVTAVPEPTTTALLLAGLALVAAAARRRS